jgi:hypothetical protein
MTALSRRASVDETLGEREPRGVGRQCEFDHDLRTRHHIHGSANQIGISMKSHHSTTDFEATARRHLPKDCFEYIERGTEDERNLRGMYRGLESLRLRHRILRDVSKMSLSTSALGQRSFASGDRRPNGRSGHDVARRRSVTGQGSQGRGVPFCVSTQSMSSIDGRGALKRKLVGCLRTGRALREQGRAPRLGHTSTRK